MGTRGKRVNVLQHLVGFLKGHISSEDKQELLGLIEDYRQGLVPLIVPLTLLKHHLRGLEPNQQCQGTDRVWRSCENRVESSASTTVRQAQLHHSPSS